MSSGNEKSGKGFDEYEVCCKLSALAVMLGNMHSIGSMLTMNEWYGIELFLQNIADTFDSEGAKLGKD